MLELFPDGFEEVDRADGIELVAYTDSSGEERLWHSFGGVRGEDVAADWRDRWKSFHHPVRVGPLWVGPPWHDPPADATAIVIDPGRAFGTGAHPTTQLCIELLLDLEPASAVDIGCGSGVLAIVAAKLGFAPVVALDADANAVEATRLNAAANGVAIDVRLADALADAPPAGEVALANITRPAAAALAPRLRSRRVVASGYLPTDEPSLPPFRHVRRVTRDGWAADLHEAM
ncbi:MAG: methyltransferase [Actinobacteria bacterium]|nr:MAG: methyltransferase [Actinomycetota bacterium]